LTIIVNNQEIELFLYTKENKDIIIRAFGNNIANTCGVIEKDGGLFTIDNLIFDKIQKKKKIIIIYTIIIMIMNL